MQRGAKCESVSAMLKLLRARRGRTDAPVCCSAALLLLAAGCSARQPPPPDLAGPLAAVVIEAALAGEPAAGGGPANPHTLLLDSVSFLRLGMPSAGAAMDATELRRQVARPFVLVDQRDVLTCPPREPCRVRDDAIYVEIWEAERTVRGLDVVVSMVYNVRGIHVMTRSATYRLVLAPQRAGWRLAAWERLPT
jgi:hypothetical protein